MVGIMGLVERDDPWMAVTNKNGPIKEAGN